MMRTILILTSLLAFCSINAESTNSKTAKVYSLENRNKKTLPGLLRTKGEIRIGVQKNAPPFTVEDAEEEDSKHPGFDVELARLIALKLGVKLKISYGTMDELIEKTSQQKLDLALGGISTDINRGLAVNFTEPYLKTTPAALISRRALPPESQSVDFARKTFTSLKDLSKAGSLRVGVHKNTTNEKILRSDPEFKIHRILTYDSNEDVVEALEDGDVDAIIADGLFIKALTVTNKGLLTGNIPLTGRYRDENIGGIIPPGNAEYWMFMNFLISELVRTGEIDTLYKKYFLSDVWDD